MTDTVTEEFVYSNHVISTVNRHGDSRFSWDPSNQSDVEAAEAHFDALKAKGFLAYRVVDGEKTPETISDFDAEAREIIMMPQTVGG